MPFTTPSSRATLVRTLREITDIPPDRAARPPLVVGARVLRRVADPAALRALAARVRDGRPLHPGTGAPSPLHELREELEDAVASALSPVEVRTDLRIRLGGTAPVSDAGDPWPCRAVGPGEAGWWTSVRWAVAVEVPPGAAYTVHTPDVDLALQQPGRSRCSARASRRPCTAGPGRAACGSPHGSGCGSGTAGSTCAGRCRTRPEPSGRAPRARLIAGR
jgi:hypothetical protein